MARPQVRKLGFLRLFRKGRAAFSQTPVSSARANCAAQQDNHQAARGDGGGKTAAKAKPYHSKAILPQGALCVASTLRTARGGQNQNQN